MLGNRNGAPNAELQTIMRASSSARWLEKGRERMRERRRINFHPAAFAWQSCLCNMYTAMVNLTTSRPRREKPLFLCKMGGIPASTRVPGARHARIDLSITRRYSPSWRAIAGRWANEHAVRVVATFDLRRFREFRVHFYLRHFASDSTRGSRSLEGTIRLKFSFSSSLEDACARDVRCVLLFFPLNY